MYFVFHASLDTFQKKPLLLKELKNFLSEINFDGK